MWCKREKLKQLINFVLVKCSAYLLCVELTFLNFAAGILFVLVSRIISMVGGTGKFTPEAGKACMRTAFFTRNTKIAYVKIFLEPC